jgi:hypothetical protein
VYRVTGGIDQTWYTPNVGWSTQKVPTTAAIGDPSVASF